MQYVFSGKLHNLPRLILCWLIIAPRFEYQQQRGSCYNRWGDEMRTRSRLVFTILLTLVEEIAIAVFVLWGLPKLGVRIPLGGVIGMMVGLAAFGVITYRKGSRALMKKPMVGLPDMVGSKGKVVSPLTPGGTVRIGSELWTAKSTGRKIDAGEEVIVVRRDGLKLVVRKSSPDDGKGH